MNNRRKKSLRHKSTAKNNLRTLENEIYRWNEQERACHSSGVLSNVFKTSMEWHIPKYLSI